MTVEEELNERADTILDETWDIRNGQVVPETEDLGLGNKAVRLSATILYADLADSTELAMYNQEIAAELFKTFLAISSYLIGLRGGEIRSFDGDRVMAVFLGDYKNTSAAKCALHINWAFLNIIKPKFQARYAKLGDGTYKLAHCVGLDTGDVLVVRGGIRNNNDLVWVGQAPNIAAKLSSIREESYYSYLTKPVYDALNGVAKTTNGQDMWERRTWTNGLVNPIYRSSWTWKP